MLGILQCTALSVVTIRGYHPICDMVVTHDRRKTQRERVESRQLTLAILFK